MIKAIRLLIIYSELGNLFSNHIIGSYTRFVDHRNFFQSLHSLKMHRVILDPWLSRNKPYEIRSRNGISADRVLLDVNRIKRFQFPAIVYGPRIKKKNEKKNRLFVSVHACTVITNFVPSSSFTRRLRSFTFTGDYSAHRSFDAISVYKRSIPRINPIISKYCEVPANT